MIVVAILVTAALAPGVLRLNLRTDGHALVPADAPAVQIDEAVRREFGIEDQIVILIRSRQPDGIFNLRTLRLIKDLTGAVQHSAGIDSASVQSLATEPSDRFRTGSLSFRTFLESVPETPSDLQELRDDLKAIAIYTGTLVSYDGRAASILAGVAPQVDRTGVVAAIHYIIARSDTTGHEVDVVGAPVAEALLGSHILADLGVPAQILGARFAALNKASMERAAQPLSRLRIFVAEHIGLLPLAIAIMAIVFIVTFRSLVAAALPLGEVGAALLVVFGLMGWLGVPVYLTTAILPVILVSIGLADEIHVFATYAQRRAARPLEDVVDAVRETMNEMCRPVATTALTAAIGFLSFATSPLPPVRVFGLFAGVGILFCMLWSLTVIPALIVLLKPSGFRSPGDTPAGKPRKAFATWAETVLKGMVRRPGLSLAVALLAIAATPFGIRRVKVQDSWIAGFAADSGFYRATQHFNEQFLGAHVLLLLLDTEAVRLAGEVPAPQVDHHWVEFTADRAIDPKTLVGCRITVTRRPVVETEVPVPGSALPMSWDSRIESAERAGDAFRVTMPRTDGSPRFLLQPAPEEMLGYEIVSERFAEPDVLGRVAELENLVRDQKRYAVGGVLGPPDYIATTEFIVMKREAGSRRIPEDPDRVRWLWNQYGRVRGAARLREVVNHDFGRAVVSAFMKDANFVGTANLMRAIRDFEREHLAPHGMRISFAGDVAVSQAMIEGIVTSQVRSLLFSLIGVLVVTAFLLRSLRWGSYCMIPAALAVALTFAVMGWVGMPLGVATSMFAGMILGIGVDFAIHLIERFRLARTRGVGKEDALAEALGATLPAILIAGLAVALGFGILVVSRVPANARLGGMTVVCLVSCLAATLLVIPPLLRFSPSKSR